MIRNSHCSLALPGLLVAAWLATGGTLLAAESGPAGSILIDDVRLVDGTGVAAVDSAAVLVVDGRIAAVGPAGSVAAPDGARRIDGSGRTLVPGLVDMHAHLALGPVEMGEGPIPTMRLVPDDEVAVRSLRSLLAHGVTTIRDPGGETARTVALRERVARGDLVGPRMFVAGSVIDRMPFEGLTTPVASAEEVRAEVRAQAEAGVDFVKLYVTLTPDLVAAAIDEARRQGVGTIAHTFLTTWTEAADLGLGALVHILPGSPALLPEEHREAYAVDMLRGAQILYSWFEYVDLDAAVIDEMIEALVRNEVTVDPTLVMWETVVRGDDPTVVESPDLALVPDSLVENWRTSFHMNIGWEPEDFERGRAAFPKALELTRRLHEAGVLLTAGTDANNPWVVPGPSLHRELELLVEAGIEPLEVLAIATRNGARVLGIEDEVGTIEAGKRADMVLVAGDPSSDISATRDIVWVMRQGEIFVPSELLER